jgi:hypothetical protein
VRGVATLAMNGSFHSGLSELERDFELERKKVHDLQDATRERDKEYQKLKVNQHISLFETADPESLIDSVRQD